MAIWPFKKQNGEPKVLRFSSFRASRKARVSQRTLEPLSGRPPKPGLLRFTLSVLYRNLYMLGITLLRRRLVLRRRLRAARVALRLSVRIRLESLGSALARVGRAFLNRFKAPFARIRRTYTEVKPQVQVKLAMGKAPLAEFFAVAETVFRLIFKIISTAFNYTAPVAAGVFLLVVLGRWINEESVYTVKYQGEILGYVSSQAEFYAAAQDVRERTTTEGEDAFKIFNPNFELMRLSEFKSRKDAGDIPKIAGELERDELADMLIRMSGSTVEEAYGLYIDDEFYGAILDKDVILNEFDSMRRRSLSGKPDEEVNFAKRIALKPGLYLEESIAPEYVILGEISRNETAEEIYVVEDGDTPTGIADKIGVPYSLLKELNPEIEENLMPGMELVTQVAKPFLSVETSYTDIVEEPLPFETVESENATYARGFREVDQEGRSGLRRVTYRVTAIDGVVLDKEELEFDILREPVHERVTVGVNDPTPVWAPAAPSSGTAQAPQSSAPVERKPGGFIWPVGGSGGRITCYLNGYAGHTGVDISVRGGYGTPILASASGVVVKAQSSWGGYGRHIIVDHGGGMTTLYAHNTELYVSPGDRVGQGQIIAGMGATGNAYGVHLHFEVRQNNRIMNPVNYIGG